MFDCTVEFAQKSTDSESSYILNLICLRMEFLQQKLLV